MGYILGTDDERESGKQVVSVRLCDNGDDHHICIYIYIYIYMIDLNR